MDKFQISSRIRICLAVTDRFFFFFKEKTMNLDFEA